MAASDTSAAGTPAATPATSLIAALAADLRRHTPFAQMAASHVADLVAASTQAYFAPGERITGPDAGPPTQLYVLRQGRVAARSEGDGRGARAPGAAVDETVDPRGAEGARELVPGDVFPLSAWLAGRTPGRLYTAVDDVFLLAVPQPAVERAERESPAFAGFLHRRMQHLLDLSREALRRERSGDDHELPSLETPLAALARRPPVAVPPGTPLGAALERMHASRVGSLLVLDAEARAEGILTRHDILDRVALPQRDLHGPVDAVTSRPVVTLDVGATAHDAAVAMARHGIRHVPVTEAGRVVGVVSERDLFALRRLSPKDVGTTLRRAPDVETLRHAAGEIRRIARRLLHEGVHARQLTSLVSHLNDVLTARLVELTAAHHGADLSRACWLAFGSEGRAEQTIATDQDNGLVFASDAPERDRPAWLAFARDVNAALDACGYPLCKGGIMAGLPPLCRSVEEWRERFAAWIAHGAPEDLLAASIHFDLRPIAGAAALAEPLAAFAHAEAARTPRFIRQLAENALRFAPPLNWHGGLVVEPAGDAERIDIKLRGTAILVDTARLYALAHGIRATGTRARLEAVAPRLGAPPRECEAWVEAFEFLQTLRLRVQSAEAVEPELANTVDVARLNDIDRRILKESLLVVRALQRRVALDWLR
jgi:CBS domain-containing protein